MEYNDLVSVEAADAELRTRSDDFAPFLEALFDLATRHAMAGKVGAFLLHRHFFQPAGTRIVEKCLHRDGSRALVTAPSTAFDARADLPVRWSLGPGGKSFVPLEYSEDPGVRASSPVDSSFLAAYGSLLQRFDLTDVVGLGIATRDYLKLEPGEYYLEETTPEASVVVKSGEPFGDADTIVTMWVPEVVAGCQVQNHCRQWSTCRRTAEPDSRHVYAFGHDQERNHYRV